MTRHQPSFKNFSSGFLNEHYMVEVRQILFKDKSEMVCNIEIGQNISREKHERW